MISGNVGYMRAGYVVHLERCATCSRNLRGNSHKR